MDTVTVQVRTLKIVVPGSGGSATGTFYYRYGGQQSYTSAAMTAGTGDTLSYSVGTGLLTSRGLDYYMEVNQGGLSGGVGSMSSPYAFVVSMTNGQGQRPSAMPDASYRIIGVPIDVSGSASVQSVFADDLGDYDTRYWRLGRYVSAGDSVVPYPNSASVAPGKGYWLIARGGRTYGAAGYSMRPNYTYGSTQYYEVPLDSGWNQLANPLPFNVDWSEVRFDDNGVVKAHDAAVLEDSAYYYNGSAYTTVTTINGWEGVFVFIKKSGVSALFEYHEATASPSPTHDQPYASASSSPVWQLELTLEENGRYDAGNFVGVYPNALAGPDGYDFSEPPRAPEGPMLAFRLPGADSRLRRSDFRPQFADGATWEVVMTAGTARRMTVTGVDNLPGDLEAWLILDVGTVVPLVDGEQIDVPDDATSAQLVVGNHLYASDRVSEVLPDNYALNQNFPNPFNPRTSIRFALPSAAHVKLEVYNILGQRVSVLLDEWREVGHHTVVWDGRDNNGRGVASGVYFYRIEAEGFRDSKKMLLLK